MAALSGPPTVRQNHHSAMITFVLTLEDALCCRFSISPVGEVGTPSAGTKLTRLGAVLIGASLVTLAVGLIQTA